MAEGRSGPVFRVVADYREFGSGVPEALRLRQDVLLVGSALGSGDYVTDKIMGIERKTASDFAKSVFDGRLFRQVSALRRRYERPLLLLEGLIAGQETSGVTWPALRGAIISVTVVFGVPIVFSSGPGESAELIAIAARQIAASVCDDGYVRPGYRPKGWRKRSLYLLQGLPGVGPKRAAELLAACGSVRAVFAADEASLASIPGLGPAICNAIVKSVGEETAIEPAGTFVEPPASPAGITSTAPDARRGTR
jgi:ERCC4-type nuclease